MLFIKKSMKASTWEKRVLPYFALDQYSLNKAGFMSQSIEHTYMAVPNDHYSIFSVESLHFLHLGISEMLSECLVAYLSSHEKETSPFKEVLWKVNFL